MPTVSSTAGRLRHTIYGLQTIKKMVYFGLKTQNNNIFMVSKTIMIWQTSWKVRKYKGFMKYKNVV